MSTINVHAVLRTAISARGRSVGERYRVVMGSRMWELNETGAFIWRQCRGELTVEQILVAVAHEFQSPRSETDEESLKFLTYLADQQLITIEG